jgi:hypothetical protein
MIHEENCTYEVAKLAKEKGFNVPTRTVKVEKIEGTEKEVWDEEECRYITQWETRSLRIPTQNLLQRWLREEKRIEVNAFWDNADDMWLGYAQEMDAPDLAGSFPLNKPFDTYELALEDALKYALENLV